MTQDINYSDIVRALAKPGAAIVETLTPEKAHAIHMAIGISGEAGELLDAIKKYVIYNKDLDRTNVIEELGDISFYFEGLCQCLNITREEILAANITKLSVRYNGLKYSDKAAQERADKNVSAFPPFNIPSK
jgi:NTP pyrophosphatase (non-canonical NTP hydrolase)